MNRPSISFVIPYYKVELPLLARAVESVSRLGQKADWEAWIVDDGTPESEAGRYLASCGDPRVRYYFQPNGGLGSARNTGMKLARKEYIQFLDADDYLFPKAYSLVLDAVGSKRPDLVSFNFKKTCHTELRETGVPRLQTVFRGSGTEFMLRHNLHGSAWGYVFKKSILGDLKFTPGIYHEDEEFTPLLFLKARHVMVTDVPAYAYFQRRKSIMHQSGRDILAKRYSDLQDVILHLADKSRRLHGDAAAALGRRVDLLCMAMVYTLLGDSPDTAFLLATLENMKRAGLYPLAPRFHSFPYAIVRWCTINPACTAMLGGLFRLLGLRHVGRVS